MQVITLNSLPRTAEEAKALLVKIDQKKVEPHPDNAGKILARLRDVADGKIAEENQEALIKMEENIKAKELILEALDKLTETEIELRKLNVPYQYSLDLLDAKKIVLEMLQNLSGERLDIAF